MKRYQVKVDDSIAGMRLDLALVKADIGLSRRRIRSIIDVGGAYVNGKRVRISSRQVNKGDVLILEYSPTGLAAAKKKEFNFTDKDVLYRDHGIVAINKPPGLPAQPTRDQAVVHVAKCLQEYFQSKGERSSKLTLVHRLDMETSGVMLLAETKAATAWLGIQFKTRKVAKKYLAVCYGIPRWSTHIENARLSGISPRSGSVHPVGKGGHEAETKFTCLAINRKLGLSLIECRPHTGRSHQIRVHLQINDLPIVGDKRYGNLASAELPPEATELASAHQLLHASQLKFQPTEGGAKVTLEAHLPCGFERFMNLVALDYGN